MNIKLVISSSFVLRRLSSKYNYPLTLRLLSGLYCINEFNAENTVCMSKHVISFYQLNAKRLSAPQGLAVLSTLESLGFINRIVLNELGKGYSFTLTNAGKQLLNDYNRLLSSQKIKGLPVSGPS
jgi:hypothetical protein